jgi:hypothetical protein
MRSKVLVLTLLGIALAMTPRSARAFCGFYVSGGDASLFNNATMVVMMRDGQRTVLAMQNNYQGPPANFAMVVPVPTVLQKENVKTLPLEVFKHIDQLAAPRLACTVGRDSPGALSVLLALGLLGTASSRRRRS